MSRRLDDVRLAAMMIDGIELKGRCCVVALGITTEGVKVPLGLWDGSTENATVTRHLLADLIDRGLDVEQGVLVVLDGSKALRAAVDAVLGPVPVQRCIRHKECHEAVASAAGSSLGDVPVREESRDAAVRWDRLGHAARAVVCRHAGGCRDR
jgi:transposase-like protein